jgi:ubiquinone/menaquinone biosynthesis C-methylase UbiE
VRLSDDEYVSKQYQETANLDTRISVWRANVPDRSPQDLALAAVREAAPTRVLEVGSGKGSFAARIAKEIGCEVVASDSSAAMVSSSRSLGLDAVMADVRSLPFENGSFDVVVAAWMLYHVSPLDRGLEEVVRVLRPRGRLVAITNGRSHLAELWRVVGTESGELAFSVENGEAVLQSHFAVVNQLDASMRATFETRTSAAAYLDSLGKAELSKRLPELGWPFEALGATSVFVADDPLYNPSTR